MIARNLKLLLAGVLLISAAACKKQPLATSGSGNVTGTTGSNNGPSTANDGVTFTNSGSSAIFNLYAPGKNSVSVIGDFNNWQADSKYAMTKSSDGTRWTLQVDNLDPNKEYAYQFLIDNTLKVADPYCEKILDPNNDQYISSSTYPNLKPYPAGQTGIVSVFQANQPSYTWKNSTFTRPDKKNLVIYELLVRDFTANHDYKTIIDSLGYLSNLGVNAIELMPVNEFEGNISWGYNPDFYFAPDKYYGTKNDLKAFIDACHSHGMAVIQDMVLNHSFGSSPMVQMYFNTAAQAPAANNPWYNVTPTHPYNVGYQFNHESAATKYFVKKVVKFWMQEYKIDGFRFDLAKGFTQTNSGSDVAAWGNYDASRVAIWTDYNNYIKSIDPNLYVILEYFAGNQEEAQLAGLGMMTWGNMSVNAQQALMSYNDAGGSWDLSGLFYDKYGFPSSDYLVSYFESHDEERLQYKNEQYGNTATNYSVKDLATGLKRDEMGAAFMFSAPGPKMLWQFGELGYDVTINYNNDRTGPKPIHWEYNSNPNRRHLYSIYAQMIKMKIKNPVFTTTNYKYDLAGAVKTIQLNGTDGTKVEVVGNFDVVNQTGTISFASTGTYYDNITGTSINVTAIPYSMTLAPGEYHVYSNTPLKQ